MKYTRVETLSVDKAWDYLIDNEIATEETLRVVTNINGYNLDTLQDVLYSVTGYRDILQYESESE